MIKIRKSKRLIKYDLEDRTFEYARAVRKFVKRLPRTFLILEDIRQLLKSSGSVGANYIEANEAVSKKDFLHRIKICRKEIKESGYWLRLLSIKDRNLEKERNRLIQETTELTYIFGAIVSRTES